MSHPTAMLCSVCHRPSSEVICSQRCHGLAKLRSRIDPFVARRLILEELGRLEKDASICPGRLSKKVLDAMAVVVPEERDALSLLRGLLFQMRAEGQLRFFQKNVLIPPGKGPMEIRGPLRVKARK